MLAFEIRVRYFSHFLFIAHFINFFSLGSRWSRKQIVHFALSCTTSWSSVTSHSATISAIFVPVMDLSIWSLSMIFHYIVISFSPYVFLSRSFLYCLIIIYLLYLYPSFLSRNPRWLTNYFANKSGSFRLVHMVSTFL